MTTDTLEALMVIVFVGAFIFVITAVIYEIVSEYRYKKQMRGDKNDKHRYFK